MTALLATRPTSRTMIPFMMLCCCRGRRGRGCGREGEGEEWRESVHEMKAGDKLIFWRAEEVTLVLSKLFEKEVKR